MSLKGKLQATGTLRANTSVPEVIRTGGVSSWNELTGKPFSTINQDDFVVESGELQINKSSVLDGYATEQYVQNAIAEIPTPEVEIDNKSLISVNGVIQEAVPIYLEEREATEEYGPGLWSDSGFEYPAAGDFDYYFDSPSFRLYTETGNIYRFAMKLKDGTVYDGMWYADGDGHTYGGRGKWGVGDNSYELYIDDEGNNRWKLHAWLGWGVDLTYKIECICLYQVEDVPAGYPSIQEICIEDFLMYDSLDNSATVYHKLPSEYIDLPFPEVPKNHWGEYILVAHCQGDNIYYEWTPYYN